MILETEDQEFKWAEWYRKKKSFYEDHGDFGLLQQFIHHHRVQNALYMSIPGTKH